MHFADRLIGRARTLGTAVCVGLDPRWELLPPELRRRARELESDPARAAAWAYRELAATVIEATAPFACAVKVQSAFYEALGAPGVEAFAEALRLAREAGLAAIADAKRADIGSSSEAYAQAFFGGAAIDSEELPGLGADALTVNPYFGTDGVEPFLAACDRRARGLFVLVRTSNPSAAELQDLPAGAEGAPLFTHVAGLVRRWGEGRVGECGWSSVGAVAGGTDARALEEVRSSLPRAILLVPGYGAQGARAQDVARAFDARGEGAIVNASRSLVFGSGTESLRALGSAAAEAARKMRDKIADAIARRRA